MRNIIMGGIGVLWGAGILIYSFSGNEPVYRGGARVGQLVGTGMGFLLFAVGLYYLIQGIRSLNQPQESVKPKKKKKRKVVD